MVEISTEHIDCAERLDFWRETALRRVSPEKSDIETEIFSGRLRRMRGTLAELWEHQASAITVRRTSQQCRRDDCDDVSVALLLDCDEAVIDAGSPRKLADGDIYVNDYARPLWARRSDHREVALLIPRSRVRAAFGGGIPPLAGLKLPMNGIGRVLRAHLKAICAENDDLTASEVSVAVDAATEMALALMAHALDRNLDDPTRQNGLYEFARRLIVRYCSDPGFGPEKLAFHAGCSRATLYRLFAVHECTVADMIWSARLKVAMDLLRRSDQALPISEVAFRSGFLDQTTFNRMFKRRFGETPREVRLRKPSTS